MGKGNSVTEYLVSGAASGACSSLALQPLDLLKTRVQQSYNQTAGGRGAFVVARQVITDDGVRGLYKGLSPTLARSIPGVALYFYTLQSLRRQMGVLKAFAVPNRDPASSALPKLSAQGNLIAGATTRIGVGFLLNPLSVLKARYESTRYSYTSLSQAFTSITRQEGIKGLLQGFQASALRDAPYAGLYVLFYEMIKDHSVGLLETHLLIPQATMYAWSGAAAGVLATLSTQPFDVMKTRMQVQSDDPQYRTLRRTMVGIFKDRGLRGFLDGASLRMSRKVLSSAISWTVYESLLLFWRDAS